MVKIKGKGNSVDTEYPCRAGVGTTWVQQWTFHNSLLCPSRSPLKREIKAGIFYLPSVTAVSEEAAGAQEEWDPRFPAVEMQCTDSLCMTQRRTRGPSWSAVSCHSRWLQLWHSSDPMTAACPRVWGWFNPFCFSNAKKNKSCLNKSLVRFVIWLGTVVLLQYCQFNVGMLRGTDCSAPVASCLGRILGQQAQIPIFSKLAHC